MGGTASFFTSNSLQKKVNKRISQNAIYFSKDEWKAALGTVLFHTIENQSSKVGVGVGGWCKWNMKWMPFISLGLNSFWPWRSDYLQIFGMISSKEAEKLLQHMHFHTRRGQLASKFLSALLTTFMLLTEFSIWIWLQWTYIDIHVVSHCSC